MHLENKPDELTTVDNVSWTHLHYLIVFSPIVVVALAFAIFYLTY